MRYLSPTYLSSMINILKKHFGQSYKRITDFYQAICQKSKDLVGTNYELGAYHLKRGELLDATVRFKIVLLIRPEHALAHYRLGCCLQASGKKQKAVHHLQTALKLMPDLKEAQYVLATLIPESVGAPTFLPPTLIEEFVDLAAWTEEWLEESTLYANIAVDKLKDVLHPHNHVLEYGCEYGEFAKLLAATLNDIRVDGITISGAMQTKAEETAAYGEVVKIAFDAWPADRHATYQAVVSLYALGYTADCATFMQSAYDKLVNGGRLLLIAEKNILNSAGRAFSADYSHFVYAASFLEEQLKKAGFAEVAIEPFDDLAKEMLVCVAQKS